MGERLPCKQEVTSSTLVFSTKPCTEVLGIYIFLDSSAVEHSAVNRRVVGSNPTRGAKKSPVNISVCRIFLFKKNMKSSKE